MFKKLSRAWGIAKMCWNVLKLDKELIVFPLLSLITCGLLLASVVVPLWVSGNIEELLLMGAVFDEEGSFNFAGIAFDFACYFVFYFIMIFFNTGLVACARIRFSGGDPTIADGLKASIQRLPQIFVWALTTSVVGFILSRIANNQEGIGKFVFAFLGAGWAIASFFVVPVLVAEKVGPITALKKSASAIKKTWGELLIAEIGMSALAVFIIMPAFIAFFIGMMLFDQVAPVFLITLAVLVVAWVFLTSLAFSALNGILKTALYIYATEGTIPPLFDSDVIKNPAPVRESK
ncbi:MAG: hypothetical protein ACI8P9_003357 [Parasphingorhabdus sp.]|jgi:hypothetical protein